MKKARNRRKEGDEDDENGDDGGRKSLFSKISAKVEGSKPVENPYAQSSPATYSYDSKPSTSKNPVPPSPQGTRFSVDSNRSELFRGAANREQEVKNKPYNPSHLETTSEYPGSGDPEEDEEVEGVKQRIRYVKQETVSSSRNALRLAQEAELTNITMEVGNTGCR